MSNNKANLNNKDLAKDKPLDPSNWEKELNANAVHKDFSQAKDKVETHFQNCDNHLKDKDEVDFKDKEGFWDHAKEYAGDIKDKVVHGIDNAYHATKDFIAGDKKDLGDKKL